MTRAAATARSAASHRVAATARVVRASPPVSVVSPYPPDRALAYLATPAQTAPANIGDTIVDSVTGWKYKKMYDVDNAVHTYPTVIAINRTEDRYLLGLTSGSRALLSLPSLAVLKTNVAGDGRWALYAGYDANLLIRHNSSTGKLNLFDPIAGAVTQQIADLTAYNSGSALDVMAHGDQSDDGHYLLMYGVRVSDSAKVIFKVNLVTGAVVAERVVTVKPHAMILSPTGTYAALEGATENSTASEVGLWLLDSNLNDVVQIQTKRAHACMAIDAAGDEVLCPTPSSIAPLFDTNVYKYRCADVSQTKILTGPVATRHGHHSRIKGRPDWILCGTYDNQTGTDPGTDQLFALKIDGSETIELYGFTHANTTSAFGDDAMMQANNDGSIVFTHMPVPWGTGTVGHMFMLSKT